MSTHLLAAAGKKPAWTVIGALFACATGAMAETRLGYEGNIYLQNPYADPAGGLYGFGIASGDFDGDGIDDLVVSEFNLSTIGSSERFRVMRGKAYPIGGPYPVSRFTSTTVTTDYYSSVLATGDFNGDGTDEVAIGYTGNKTSGGAVYIYQQRMDGSWQNLLIRQGGGYEGVDEAGDRFGSSLASGDFDGDGYDDLAIGVPGEENRGFGSSGAVQVVYGSASGLSGTRDRIFDTLNDGLHFPAQAADYYGDAVATGDFDDDGDDDLALGVPGRECPNGGVVILKGSASSGLTSAGVQSFQPGQNGMLGDCASSGDFGASLSAGKVNGQAYMGLAIGAPRADVDGIEQAGAVHLVFGGPSGLNPQGNQRVTVTDLPGGVASPFMKFGNKVKLGQLRSGTQSLAIGSPYETVEGIPVAGAVWVLHSGNGSASISTSIVERWTASANLYFGVPESGDYFGASMAIGDFNGDGMNDIAIGAYGNNYSGDLSTGGGAVIYQSEFIFKDDFDDD